MMTLSDICKRRSPRFFCRSVLSATIQWINPQKDWDRVKMLFFGVNTGVILRWREEMGLQRLVRLLCVPPPFCVHVCVRALTCYRHATSLTWEVEIPRGQLYLRRDPRRYTDTRGTLRIPLHYLKLPAREQKRDRRQELEAARRNQLAVRIAP